jgi:hypothetical protein
MHLSGTLGYTDYQTRNGVPAQLVGNTYLPSAGLSMVDKGKGWWEVWQNGLYVGYLRPGKKNGLFVAEGSPVIWPQAAPVQAAPIAIDTGGVKVPAPPAGPIKETTTAAVVVASAPPAIAPAQPAQPARVESIPLYQSQPTSTAAYELTPLAATGGNTVAPVGTDDTTAPTSEAVPAAKIPWGLLVTLAAALYGAS